MAEAVPTCNFCADPYDDRPLTTLLCSHSSHTECCLRAMTMTDPLNLRCRTCQEWVIPRDMIDDADAVHGEAAQAEIGRYLWAQEPAFRETLERTFTAYKDIKRTRQAAARWLKVTTAAAKTDLADHIAAIETRVAANKAAYKASAERKEVLRAEAVYLRQLKTLRQRWGTSLWQLRSALREVPEAMRLIPDHFWSRRRRVDPTALNIVIQ